LIAQEGEAHAIYDSEVVLSETKINREIEK